MENKCSLSRPAMYCISDFCHLCLKDDKSLIDLSKSVPENDAIRTKLAACVSEVQWATLKRLLICIACMEKLEWAFDFKQTCIRSYEITMRRVAALKQSKKANARKARIHIPLERESIGPDLTENYLEQQLQQRHLGAVRFPTVTAPTGLILTNTGQQGSYQNMFLNFVSTNNMVYPFVTNQPVVINNPSSNDDDTILKQLLETKNSEELSVDIDPSLYDFEHFLTAAPTPAPTPNIECSQCGTAYVTIKLLRRHYDEVHGGVLPYVCTFCFSKFLLKDHYDKHMKNHLEKNGDTLMGSTVNLDNLSKGPQQRLLGNMQMDYQCRYCAKTYNCSETLEKHIEHSHGDAISRMAFCKGLKLARCERCDRDFSTMAYLQKHMKMHEADKEGGQKKAAARKNKAQDNKIDLTNDSNGLKENINTQFANCVRKKAQNNNASEQGKDEVIEVNDDSPTETGAVDFRFSDFVVEAPDGRISCSVCKKTYARKRDLRRHVNIYHVKSIVYQCHLCDEKFYEGCRLTRHLRWHYTRVSCSECRRTFTSIPEITGHMIDSYNELKGIVCNVCCVTFADVGELKVHTDTHLLEMIYKCHLCEERFGECRDLTRHLSEHNGLKSCEHCGRIFEKEENLLKHKNSCGNESYQCDVCPKVFKKKQYLKMHIIAKHADEISVDEPMKKKRKPEEEI